MKYGKEYKTKHLLRDVAVILVLAFIGVYAGQTSADTPDNRPPDNRPPEKENDVSRTSGFAKAGAAAGALATGGSTGPVTSESGASTSTAGGGDADASNDGNTYSSSNRSANFYVSRSLPGSLNECALSADAGGGDNGSAGFLGWQWIDHNCFMNGLSEMEDNADLKALLKCEAKRFRNAVAYDQPRKARQAYCHGYVKAIYLAEIAELRSQAIDAMKHELDLLRVGKP